MIKYRGIGQISQKHEKWEENKMKDSRKEFIFILGKSAGMDQDGMLKGFNALVDEQKKVGDDSQFTLAFFNDTVKMSADGKSMKEIRKYNAKTYVPKGKSALYDAMGTVCDAVGARLADTAEEERPSRVVVVVMGEADDASVTYTKEAISEMVNLQTYTYNWDFIFFGSEGAEIGIHKGGELTDAKEAFAKVSEYMTSIR